MIDRFNNDPIASHASLHSGDFTSVLWSRGQAIILAVLVVVLPACNQSVSSGSNTTISEIANESNTDLIGKTVTVSGEIEEVISPKAFTIEGDQLFKDRRFCSNHAETYAKAKKFAYNRFQLQIF